MIKELIKRQLAEKKKVNVVLVEIINRNLGDTVIADTAMYLTNRALPFLSRKRYAVHPYNVYSEDYKMIQLADLIIFDGGGIIKYKREEFYSYIAKIVDCAEEKKIPVFFNGVGVEGYDGEDEKCQLLRQALNKDCVKGISVRDDLDTLLSGYLDGNRVETCQVADPAVFTPQVYDIHKNLDSNTIGLGVVRWRIFEDHDIPEITKEYQLEMWKQVAEELEQKGYDWKIFVNGLKSDFEFAQEVLEYMGKTSESDRYLVPRPVESSELVETIASFQGIIACRMHANIVAYALKVPSVGLVWNDKLTFWGERIGYPERFLNPEDFHAEKIAACMDDCVKKGVHKKGIRFDRSVFHPLKKFVRTYGKQALHRRGRIPMGPVDWSSKLVASALGGKCLQFSNMNTPATVQEKFDSGFVHFEADVRLTCDGRLVCVNGWSGTTWQKLGLDPSEARPEGMSYDEFMSQKYYDGHYPTMDFTQLLSIMREHENWHLILDFGKPGKDMIEKYRSKLERQLGDDVDLLKKITIRLQTRFDVDTFCQSDVKFDLMFYIPPQGLREKYNITVDSVERYCKRKKIRWVSLSKEAFDEEVAPLLKESRLKVCVFSHSSVTQILDSLERGADMVGTHFATPYELNAITNRTMGDGNE